VGYHFGTKADLVRAVVRRHTAPIEALRRVMVEEVTDPTDLRAWVGCLVRPVTAHLASLGDPTWFARFGAQVTTDPAFRGIMAEESLADPSLRQVLDRLRACLPDVPEAVRADRAHMVRHLIVQVCAERERALAEGSDTPRRTWDEAATGLVDAITGLWTAPSTTSSATPPATG
ncbi:TetR family transcriptional regulator, partial [Saccharothrix longispora]|uniref:TetR family transcriptional regulator n=1 Tax=Saccharothrix longispora TaxID=33920 RepID=UPI0028FD918A